MEQTIQDLSTLKTVAEVLNRTLDLDEALGSSLKIVLDALNLRAGWIFLCDEQDAYKLVAHHGLPPALIDSPVPWQGGCRCNAMADLGDLNEAKNIVACSRLAKAAGDTGDLRYHASIQLETPRGSIGILNVAAHDGDFLDQHGLNLLNSAGLQFAIAIERALAFRQIHAQRQREQEALLQLSNALLQATDLQTVMQRVVSVAAKIFDADGALLLPNRANADIPVGWNRFTCFRRGEQFGNAATYLKKDPCQEALFRLNRPAQIVLDDHGHLEKIQIFPLEEASPEREDNLKDHDIWSFWGSLGLRSIFMSPIQSISGGEPLGMLYIVHQDIRPAYADAHLSTLLANHAALAIEQIRHWELQEKQRSIAKELAVARDIQTSTLAGCKPEYPGWSFAVRYEAARAVGGDFYDFINLPQGQLGLAVADIAGKGVPAALMMSLSRTMLRAVAPSRTAACQTLEEVNRLLLEESRKDRFVSMFYGILNPHTGSLSYARAGHNPPLYWSQYNEAVSSLSGRGIVLGVTPDPHLEQRQITMGSGDVAVFFTDGITEASNGAMEAYGEERLAHWLMANHDLAAEAMADSLMDELKAFTGPKSLDDDLTLVILKRLNSH